ncbi:xanthine dehydrogenase family protein subunit M [Amycolatopsis sp. FDAARGOS 1241]|uniref:FAD binding domain-containing protein n=1 Tax=Amycolatopsis sp. FDAARGOS 1241 TaxID=2778070 RepID=UPI00194DBD17|nr:FAD binding domain-containing protein [Amycolatopsis sp. FDAARGOS 1241]QRP43123.1 FAD binding domain-containing protein [Amycolatopsis sp. FDAARGOS 1241]
MKLPPFGYHRAESLGEAVAVLAEHGPDARVLAGGQSLLPVMALRMSNPAVLIDITTAKDLQGHAFRDADGLVVSAAVTTRTVETDAETRRRHPLVAECLAQVGHPEIRNRGTVCGSLAHADPAAELPALLLALGGSVRVAGAERRRRIAAADFFAGPYLTALEEGEVVAGAELPLLPRTAGWSIREITRRSGDFALVGVIAILDADAAGRCTDARLALFGIAGTPRRATAAEEVLKGQLLDDAVLAEAAERAFDDIDVLGDIHGSVTYRRRAGARLVARSLAAARASCQSEVESARA